MSIPRRKFKAGQNAGLVEPRPANLKACSGAARRSARPAAGRMQSCDRAGANPTNCAPSPSSAAWPNTPKAPASSSSATPMCCARRPSRTSCRPGSRAGARLGHRRIRHAAARHPRAHAARGLRRQAGRPHAGDPAADRPLPARRRRPRRRSASARSPSTATSSRPTAAPAPPRSPAAGSRCTTASTG